MKNTLLLIGFFGCYTAHAQLKDVFDIQKHLAQKTKEHKEVIHPPIIKLEPLKNLFSMNNSEIFFPSVLKTNKDKVIKLPLDNMPCFVPDMKLFQIMPNFNNKKFYNTPNLSPKIFPG